MKKIFFFSDVHLGLHDTHREKEKEERLLSFLTYIQKHAAQVIILGDLFDYWFEYKYVIPRGYHHVLSKLGMMVQNGIKIHYLAGNHDYWLKDFFPNDLGIPVLWLGVGEKADDLVPMDPHAFVAGMLGLDGRRPSQAR